jgi:hypothetical protein
MVSHATRKLCGRLRPPSFCRRDLRASTSGPGWCGFRPLPARQWQYALAKSCLPHAVRPQRIRCGRNYWLNGSLCYSYTTPKIGS